jgi:hypothetical protein
MKYHLCTRRQPRVLVTHFFFFKINKVGWNHHVLQISSNKVDPCTLFAIGKESFVLSSSFLCILTKYELWFVQVTLRILNMGVMTKCCILQSSYKLPLEYWIWESWPSVAFCLLQIQHIHYLKEPFCW